VTIRHRHPRPAAQRGVAAVEFALTALFFITFLFGIIEVARAMYLWSTLTEVTRRYARVLAVTDFNDPAALALARNLATFGSTDGSFPLGGSINGSNLKVTYLRGDGVSAVSSMPDCPAQNIINCNSNPNGASCIRFVQVRLCQTAQAGDVAGTCGNVPYTSLLALNGLFPATFKFPTFATTTPAEAFGHQPGSTGTCL
jgi:TadE-like protein